MTGTPHQPAVSAQGNGHVNGRSNVHIELGRWLREQRRLRGWDVPQMARRLAHAAGEERGSLPSKECLLVYIRRWERGGHGVSERYRLLYCRAFGIEGNQFGPGPERAELAGSAGAGPSASGAGPAQAMGGEATQRVVTEPARSEAGSTDGDAGDGQESESEPGVAYTITVQITAKGARLEIRTPCQQASGAWLGILAAVAERFGSYGSWDGEKTLWGEVGW